MATVAPDQTASKQDDAVASTTDAVGDKEAVPSSSSDGPQKTYRVVRVEEDFYDVHSFRYENNAIGHNLLGTAAFNAYTRWYEAHHLNIVFKVTWIVAYAYLICHFFDVVGSSVVYSAILLIIYLPLFSSAVLFLHWPLCQLLFKQLEFWLQTISLALGGVTGIFSTNDTAHFIAFWIPFSFNIFLVIVNDALSPQTRAYRIPICIIGVLTSGIFICMLVFGKVQWLQNETILEFDIRDDTYTLKSNVFLQERVIVIFLITSKALLKAWYYPMSLVTVSASIRNQEMTMEAVAIATERRLSDVVTLTEFGYRGPTANELKVELDLDDDRNDKSAKTLEKYNAEFMAICVEDDFSDIHCIDSHHSVASVAFGSRFSDWYFTVSKRWHFQQFFMTTWGVGSVALILLATETLHLPLAVKVAIYACSFLAHIHNFFFLNYPMLEVLFYNSQVWFINASTILAIVTLNFGSNGDVIYSLGIFSVVGLSVLSLTIADAAHVSVRPTFPVVYSYSILYFTAWLLLAFLGRFPGLSNKQLFVYNGTNESYALESITFATERMFLVMLLLIKSLVRAVLYPELHILVRARVTIRKWRLRDLRSKMQTKRIESLSNIKEFGQSFHLHPRRIVPS